MFLLKMLKVITLLYVRKNVSAGVTESDTETGMSMDYWSRLGGRTGRLGLSADLKMW